MAILWVVLLVLIAVPVLLVFISVKLWRSSRAGIRWLFLLPLGLLTYLSLEAYWAFYPREEFYRAVWFRQTGFPLSDEVVFYSKCATYPDHHGDYWAGSVMQVSSTDLIDLERRLLEDSDFTVDTSTQRIGISSEFDELVDDIYIQPEDAVYRMNNVNDVWFRVAFLKRQGVVIFERSSS